MEENNELRYGKGKCIVALVHLAKAYGSVKYSSTYFKPLHRIRGVQSMGHMQPTATFVNYVCTIHITQ
jgi:hypothetical protein